MSSHVAEDLKKILELMEQVAKVLKEIKEIKPSSTTTSQIRCDEKVESDVKNLESADTVKETHTAIERETVDEKNTKTRDENAKWSKNDAKVKNNYKKTTSTWRLMVSKGLSNWLDDLFEVILARAPLKDFHRLCECKCDDGG